MAKVSKKAEKLAKKNKAKVEEPSKTQDTVATTVEAPKPDEKPAEVVENKETKDKPQVKDEKTKTEGEVIVPEVVKPESVAITTSTSLGGMLGSDGSKDRIDKNHAIELMGIIRNEYLTNPETPEKVKKAMKRQFDVMTSVALVQYFTQLEGDFQTMGVRINAEMREQAERVLGEYLGIKVKYMQANDNSRQLVLEFKEVPEEVKENARKDAAAAKEEIPEPDPNMPAADKLKALRTIFSQKEGIGKNFLQGIEWGRKAFSFSKEEKKAVVLANLIKSGADATLLTCIKGMVGGKLNTEHSILGAHALLKGWCPSVSDAEIAELIQVIVSINSEKKLKEWNERAGDNLKTTLEKELSAVTLNILTANADKAIDAILKGENKMDFAIFSKTEVEEMFQTMFEHMPDNMKELAVKEFGSIEEWKKHYIKTVSSEEMQKGYAKVVEWYGGKEQFLSVANNPISKEAAESYNQQFDNLLYKLAAKKVCSPDSSEVRELVSEYGFLMKQLSQIKKEHGLMVAQAQYYRNEKIKPMIDEKYGNGTAEFFAQAFEAFYKDK